MGFDEPRRSRGGTGHRRRPWSPVGNHLSPDSFDVPRHGRRRRPRGGRVEGVYWRFPKRSGEPEVWLPLGNSNAIRLEPSGGTELVGPIADGGEIFGADVLPKSRYHVTYMRRSTEGESAAFIATDEYERPSIWVASAGGKNPQKVANIETSVRDYFGTPDFGIARYGESPRRGALAG